MIGFRMSGTLLLCATLTTASGCSEEAPPSSELQTDTVEFDANAARERMEEKARDAIDADNVDQAAEALQRELDADGR